MVIYNVKTGPGVTQSMVLLPRDLKLGSLCSALVTSAFCDILKSVTPFHFLYHSGTIKLHFFSLIASQEGEEIKVWVVSVKLTWKPGVHTGNGNFVLPCSIGYSYR